jgi:hypothetical protein
VLRWRSGLLETLGEWDNALEVREELLALQPGAEAWDASAPAQLMDIFVQRGQLDEARSILSGLEAAIDRHELQAVAQYHTLEAGLLLAEDRPAEALAAAEAAVAVRVELGLAEVAWALMRGLEAAFELGDDAKIDELLAIIEQTPPGQMSPPLRALGARFGARRAARQGDGATADAGFDAAAAILREMEWPFDLAVVLLEHAEWLASEGRLDEAAPLAAEAREIFERLRATPYIERVDRLPVGAAAAG